MDRTIIAGILAALVIRADDWIRDGFTSFPFELSSLMVSAIVWTFVARIVSARFSAQAYRQPVSKGYATDREKPGRAGKANTAALPYKAAQ